MNEVLRVSLSNAQISDLIVDYMISVQIIWTFLYMLCFLCLLSTVEKCCFCKGGSVWSILRTEPQASTRLNTSLWVFSLFPLPAAHCWRIWHLWSCRTGPSMWAIVRHIIYLLFTALPVVEEEFWLAGKCEEEDLSYELLQTDSQQDWTENLSRWGDETQKENVSLNQRCVFFSVLRRAEAESECEAGVD